MTKSDLQDAPVEAGVQPSSAGVFWRENLLVCLLAAVPTLIKLIYYPAYPGSDDAFIHLTMVRNLTHGLGWGINPGEPVNLSSSPLFTLLVVLLNLCGVPALPAGEWLSAVSGFFSLVLLYRLLGRVGLRPLACLSGLTIASFNVFFWRWNCIVMETSTALGLLGLAYWFYHGVSPAGANGSVPSWRYLVTGILVGLATLTRFELALVLGCFGLAEIVNRPVGRWLPSCLLLSLGFFLALAPWFIFSHYYFHSLLPTTFYKKTSSHLLLWNPEVTKDIAELVIPGYFFPLLGCLVLGLLAWWRAQTPGIMRMILGRLDIFLFPVVLGLFYYLKTAGLESAARYYMPALYVLAAALACLFDSLSQQIRTPILRRAVLGCLAAQIALALAINQFRVAPILRRFGTNYQSVAQGAAAYFRSQAAGRKLRILVEVDIGMISYYAGDFCYFSDGGALATPSLLGKSLPQQVAESKPDFVLECLSETVGSMTETVPTLALVWHRSFLSHSLGRPKLVIVTNIYKNTGR